MSTSRHGLHGLSQNGHLKTVGPQLLSFQKAIVLCSYGSTYWIQYLCTPYFYCYTLNFDLLDIPWEKTRLSFANSYLVDINKNAEAYPCGGCYYAACCGIQAHGNQC